MIKHNNKSVTIFIDLLLLQGDNLSLNCLLGFTQSFNSKHFCRLCKIDKITSTKQVELDVSELRTKKKL